MPGLDDYGALIRSGQAIVPDYAAQQAQEQLLALKRAEVGATISQLVQKQQQKQKFDEDLTQVLLDPSAGNISQLMLKHPEYSDQIKAAWDTKDKAVKQADLTATAEIYSAASSGKYDLAAKLMRKRVEADQAAGDDDPTDNAILAALESGDPTQQKAALGMIGVHLAAGTGPEHFATVLNATGGGDYTLDAGAARFSGDKMIAHSPFLKDAEGGLVDWNSVVGGDATGTPAASPTVTFDHLAPPQAAVASTLAGGGMPAPVVAGFLGNFHVEGGYEGAKGDGGTAHGIAQLRGERLENFKRIIGKNPSDASPEENAQFTLYEMQHPEEAGMTVAQRDAILAAKTPAQAAALIDQYYERSSGEHRQQRMAAANQIASGATPTGGPRVILPGKKQTPPAGFRWSADGSTLEAIPGGPADKPKGGQFRIITPAEAQAQGLDPNTKYQVNTETGAISAIGGQARQAKQIPQGVLTKVQPAIDVRDTMARLAGTWRGNYGGHTILGDNLNSLQRNLGKLSGAPEGMANWWADFQNMDNLIRNQLFGSALTEHEKQAYAATTITPRMDSGEIVKRFNRRRAIINAVAARQQNFLKKNGYDPEAVDALYSPLGGDTGQPSAAPAQKPVRVRSVQEAQKLPTGALFITPDGRVLRKR